MMRASQKSKTVFNIGYKIKAYREANRLTQEQLAELMNCSFKTIGNMENDRVMPDLKQVINLCDLLNISVDELLSDCLNKGEKNASSLREDDYDSYPDFVYRTPVRNQLSRNSLQQVEKIAMKIRTLAPHEINMLDGIIDNILNNRG